MGRLLSYVIRRLAGRGLFKDLYPESSEDQTARSREIASVGRQIERMRKDRERIGKQVDSSVNSLKAMNESNHYGEAIMRAFFGEEE